MQSICAKRLRKGERIVVGQVVAQDLLSNGQLDLLDNLVGTVRNRRAKTSNIVLLRDFGRTGHNTLGRVRGPISCAINFKIAEGRVPGQSQHQRCQA